jgi:hypothetical protein
VTGERIDPDVHAKVIETAAEDGVSLSAWMTAAARRELLVRDGLVAVAPARSTTPGPPLRSP